MLAQDLMNKNPQKRRGAVIAHENRTAQVLSKQAGAVLKEVCEMLVAEGKGDWYFIKYEEHNSTRIVVLFALDNTTYTKHTTLDELLAWVRAHERNI